MEALEAILTRRSVRKYTNKTVSEEVVKEILEAAMNAPSAGNEQPWQFIVITDRQILNEIPRIHPYAQMASQAQLAILVCGDLNLETHNGYWSQDCSAATENLLIAAHAKGLGAVWTGVYPREERVDAFRKLLNLPNHVVPFALIPIGYPAEKVIIENRYKPSRIHKNKW